MGLGRVRLGARWPALRSRLGGAAAADCRCALARHTHARALAPAHALAPTHALAALTRALAPRMRAGNRAPRTLCAGPRRTGVDALVRAVHYNVQDLANIAWGFAASGVSQPELLTQIATVVERSGGGGHGGSTAVGSGSAAAASGGMAIRPQDCADLGWALAWTGVRADAVYVLMGTVLRGRAAELSTAQLPRLVWGCAALAPHMHAGTTTHLLCAGAVSPHSLTHICCVGIVLCRPIIAGITVARANASAHC